MARILLLDDEPALLEIGKIFLERPGGLEVECAGSVAEALEMLQKQQFDAIVSDYQMPETNGIDFLKAIRKCDPAMPFIIFTGRGREEVAIEALNHGADYYIQKGGNPQVQFAELRHKINLALERSRGQKALSNSEKKLHELLETLPEIIVYTTDTMGIITFMNQNGIEAFGQPPDEVIGIPWTTLIHPGDCEEARVMHHEVVAAGNPVFDYKCRFIADRGRGRAFPAIQNVTALYDDDGSVIGVQGLALDISRRGHPDETDKGAVSDTGKNGRGSVTRKKQAGENSTVEHELALGLAAVSTLEEALPLCVHAAIQISGMDAGGIYLFDAASGDLVLAYATGLHAPFINATSRLDRDSRMARYIGANMIIDGGYDDFEEYYRVSREKEGLKAGIDIPILHNDRVIGCYNLASYTSGTVSPGNRMALKVIAAQVGNVITRIQAEEALKKSEERFRELTVLLPQPVFETDIRGNITFANQSALRAYGYSMDAVEKGINIAETVIPGERNRIETFIEGGFSNINPHGYEFTALRRDGSTFRILIYTSLIRREDQIDGLRGIIIDIDHRKEMEDALKESEERLNLAIEGGNIGVWDWDVRTGRTVYNPQWASILGYTLTELEGVDNIWEHLVHPEDLPLAKKEVNDHFAGKTPYYECYYRMRAKDGGWVWIHDLGKIAEWDEASRPLRMTGIHLDITETQRYREALRETNRKLNLLSSITRHDILNQITGILGYLELVEEISRADPRVHRYIERIQLLTGKIQDQIVFTQHYQDLGVKAPRWHHVEEVVRKAADAATSSEFIVSIETGNLEIFADPLLEHVFFNLVDNAKRHGGEVSEVSISCAVQGGSTTIVVEDDGNGIPESQKGWIFQRGSGTNTGLGLFLVREILGITGIAIDETGIEGEGARFEITVPADVSRYRPAGSPECVSAPGAAGSNRQINN